MYLVKLDNNALHDPRLKDYQILNPVLNLEVNKTNSFNFTIYHNNPMYNSIRKLKSIIEVYDDGELIFRGRPLNDTTDFMKAVTIQCEGELGYLNDSTMEPYSYFGPLRGLLQLYINNHNSQVDASKQFTLGKVDVPGDFVRSNIEHTNTWEELSTKTFGSSMGGYLRLRRENGVNYIDYLSDSPYISGQTIELSKNLLDYEKTVKATDIVTVLIPLGAKLKDEEGNETDERLTIESVNSGSKFIEHTAGITKYGRIVGYKVWDNINTPELLKTRATNDLNFLVNLGISIKIKAIDLSLIDKSIPKISFFEYVKIISKPHEIDDSMLIKKQTIYLDKPSENTIEVGVEVSSFIDKQLEANNTIKIIKSDYVTNEKLTNVTTPLITQVSEIIQESDRIKLSVQELQQEMGRIETETTAKIEANTEGIFLEKSEREAQYGNLENVVSDQGTSLSLLNDQINTTIENRLTDAERTVEEINKTVSTVQSTQQTFTNRITNLEGEMTEQQTFFRTEIDGLFIGGTDWETVMKADGEKISFVNQTGGVQAHFGANGMYVNRWELDYHTIEKFEEGNVRGTIFKNRRSGN